MSNERKMIALAAIPALLIAGWFSFGYMRDDQPRPMSSLLDKFTPYPQASSTPTRTASPAVKPTTSPGSSGLLLQKVPYISQAALGEWSDPRQQDGCEEASSAMAMAWVRGRGSFTPQQALEEVLAVSTYLSKKYNNFRDTSAEDTAEWIIRGYYGHQNVSVKHNIDKDDIIAELKNDHVVIVPVNGQLVGNPFYTAPGPLHHMMIIIGYDPNTREFITNDPGLKTKGVGYRYSVDVLENALQDYETGSHVPIVEVKTAMIVVGK
ncbi:MAG: C39 family peptidase [bacterium]|nr:C39 family peptidase [bacterium]